MTRRTFQFDYDWYSSADEIVPGDAELLNAARQTLEQAYAPYSQFRVGAAARLSNGIIMVGSNQENASYPAGICAERVLLSSISALHPGIPIEALAISYSDPQQKSDHPISPCGICRQSLQEYESRFQKPIRLILGGVYGPILIIPSSAMLLPLSFSADDLGLT